MTLPELDPDELRLLRSRAWTWTPIGAHYGCSAERCRDVYRRSGRAPSDNRQPNSWPTPSLPEEAYVLRLLRDRGLTQLPEVPLKQNRFGVVLNDNTAVVSTGVTLRVAA